MAALTDYEACLENMYSLRRFGIKLGLSTIRNILKGLGNPQKRFTGIHIAGTNGKGSIASGIASILKASGYRVGLYTSPHLVRFNERIQIDGKEISDHRVVDAYNAVRHVHYGDREPTFFEFATAMAFHEFAATGVDWGIIETGMGGRLDATNILKPAVCVITNISLEHKFYLGNTIAEISGEKAGIIKKHIPVVSGVRQKQARSVVSDVARAKSAPLFRFGKDFRVRRRPDGGFDYYGFTATWKGLNTSLMGRHQVDNAAIMLAVCEVLKQNGTSIQEQDLRKGLAQINWPGRLEKVSDAPLIILDGAHNLSAARNLAKLLRRELKARDITMVLGMLDDKPYRQMLQALVPMCRRVILTRPVIDRALEPHQLFEAARHLKKDIAMVPDVDTAVKSAVTTAKKDDVICIAGSLYVVGEAKQALAKMGIGKVAPQNCLWQV
jgi:dihydrofolate synthase/folylpolyglutamate synthase